MLAVFRAVLVIDPACFKSSVKSFNVLFFHPLAGKSLVSLTASQHLANYNFFNKNYLLYPQTRLLFDDIGVAICFVAMATAAAGTLPY